MASRQVVCGETCLSFSKETAFGGLGLEGGGIWKEGRGVPDGEVKGPLNARLLGGGGSKGEGLVLGALSSSQWVSEQGWKWGSTWGQPHQIHLREAGEGIPVGDSDPVPCHLSAVRTQSDKQARGGRFIQERTQSFSSVAPPLRSLLHPAGSLPRVPNLGASHPQGKAWAPVCSPTVPLSPDLAQP